MTLLFLLLASDPLIIPRKSWDLLPPKKCCTRYDVPLRSVLKWIVVHHSDLADTPGPLWIKEYHQTVRGFGDIGYHYVISPDGTIYEGRPLEMVGAHAGITKEGGKTDPDYGSIGVVLDGEYTESEPPPAQASSLYSLVMTLRKRFKIPSDHVIGHRDVKPLLIEANNYTFVGELKICPGDSVEKLVEIIRQEP